MKVRPGRKRRLSIEEGRELRAKYLYGQALMEEAKKFTPTALSREYSVSIPTVFDYAGQRHKGDNGYGLDVSQAVSEATHSLSVEALRKALPKILEDMNLSAPK